MPLLTIARAVVPLVLSIGIAPMAPARASRSAVAPVERQPASSFGEYDRAEAAARSALEAARAKFGAGSLEAAGAADALVRALLRNGRAWTEEARALSLTTLANKESVLGTGHIDLVPSLVNVGDSLVADAQYAPAIAVLERGAALFQSAGGTPTLATAEALDRLASALTASGSHDAALQALERSLRIKEGLSARTPSSLARTLEGLASAAQGAGQYEKAGESIRRAQELQESSDPEHPAFVETLNLLAQQLWFEGHLPESRRASERAFALAGRTLRPTHPTLLEAMRYLASTLADLGDLTQSHVLRERALAIAEREFGVGHHETAGYLNSLAMAESQLGAYPAARERYERALAAVVPRYGRSHDYVASTGLNLAILDVKLGDYAKARLEHGRAVAIWQRTLGRNHPFVAVALTELATVLNEEGRPAEALPLLERALAIREKNLGSEHRDVARTLADLAAVFAAARQPTHAQALATRALRIWERLDAPDAPEFAAVLTLYAGLQARRGDAAAARTYFERALAIRAKVFGPTHPAFAEIQAGLASALATLGDRAAALKTAVTAETTGRDHLRLMLRSLPERQALLYAAARPRGLSLIFSLGANAPDAVPVGLDALIRSRALVLDEIAARRSAANAIGGHSTPTRVALTSAQQRLANLQVRGPGQMSPAQYTALVAAARRDGEVAEQALAEASAEFRAERTRARIGLDEVRAALPADSALVSFARYDRTILTEPRPGPMAKTLTRASPVVPSYVAFVLRADRPAAVVPVGSARVIDALVSQWRADIAVEVATTTTPGTTAASSRQSGAALRRRVWDGLAPHLVGASKVFVVPDGALGVVPFAALPVGQRSYLIDAGPVIHYLSTERDLVPAPAALSPSRGLLAVGGPSFDDRSVFARTTRSAAAEPRRLPAARRGSGPTCAGLQAVTFQPLGGTLREVRDVSGVWNANTGSAAESATVVVGRDASEAGFKRDAPGHRVLHIATHGFFLNGACAPAPGTRGVGGLSTSAGPSPVENPLLLSGLALAGANRRASAGPNDDDGILTAEEVASLNLDGVEWAVLSACDTGVGEIKAGEGVFGLRRAFQVAGARTVVMSLWSVDDQATRAWMRALYEGRFQRKLSTADAVHAASLSLLRDRRAKGQSTHPFYWAAFVAAGDWR